MYSGTENNALNRLESYSKGEGKLFLIFGEVDEV